MKTFLPILALIIILGSGLYVFTFYRSQPEPGQPVAHKAPVACEACKKAYITMLSTEPATCAYCGKQTVWLAGQCAKCGEIIPRVGGPAYGDAAPRQCPNCGPTRFKEVSPDGLEER